jgi:hypothetical protein
MKSKLTRHAIYIAGASGGIAIFIAIVGWTHRTAARAELKADRALIKASEIAVIQNDVKWIKKYLEKEHKTP